MAGVDVKVRLTSDNTYHPLIAGLSWEVDINGWAVALSGYVGAAMVTLYPALRTLFRVVNLNPGGPSFADSSRFGDEAKKRLSQNFERIQGTLVFWKTQAERYRRFHIYSLVWVTVSTVSLPILAQAITPDPWSKALVTVIAAHAALTLGLSRGFRVEANYKAFRSGESDFYDLYRRMLDRPEVFGATEAEQVQKYLEHVEMVRRVVRTAETDNLPSIEEVAQAGPAQAPRSPSGPS
ncbi:hypothetical protein O7623_10820 [Solwaraspora sp. WMMD791]|uniref:hypothetical protein n=1 Tax=Solwaraspora sp. WMMD791 TaxID=3016086 RepID=UPI002499E926|nr:hypothetical protein [Solwaraspora sp. WMMD791]WFE29639.1 hypothetical protein O7623_10820 [Solwaraspora sp. WMMD791]